MADTIYTGQVPVTTDFDGAAHHWGMKFTVSAACQCTGAGVRIPGAGRPTTMFWQLWRLSDSTLLAESNLHAAGHGTPTSGTWYYFSSALFTTPGNVPLVTGENYCCNVFFQGGDGLFTDDGSETFPVSSGGLVSSSTGRFNNGASQGTVPATDYLAYFFADVQVASGDLVIDVGIASEQDHGVAVGATIENVVGIASEQDHGVAVGATIENVVGIASEQDHAQSAGATVVTAVGIASEQDHGVAVGATIENVVGIASEQDHGLAAAPATVTTAVGIASEQDHARSAGATVVTAVGIASEQDHGLAAAPATIIVNVGIANEKDHALDADVGATIVVPVGIASEIDYAIPVKAHTPGVPQLAHLTWAIAKLLRDCLCTKLLETVAGAVCRCSLMAGDTAIADICEDVPGVGNGQAWVRMVRLFLTNDFPRPMIDRFDCAGGQWAAEFELGVLRCAVTPDGEGQPPDAFALNAETAMVFDDAYALRLTAECCLPSSIPSIAGEWQPLASGGCTGGKINVTLLLAPGPHDLLPSS